MRSNPLIVNSPNDVGRRLTRIEAKPNDPKNEAWLQELLYSHPELLPTDEFDDLYAPAIPIGREVHTARGSIDNLYVSPEGGITIVETKLWRNPEKHRTVVAQILDYAKEVAAWNYDQLCAAVLASSRQRGETDNASLDQKVAVALSAKEMELHEFQEGVAACLARAKFLLLIVGDRISPNIALLSNAIQSAPGLHFTLGLVEMQLYELTTGSDWPIIVVPEVLGRTVERTRGVVKVCYAAEKPQVTVEVDGDETDGPGTAETLDRDSFSAGNSPDLVPPYAEGIDAWEALGGTIRFTPEMMFLEMDFGGAKRKIVRCRKYKVSVIRRDFIEPWGGGAALYDRYLDDLEAAPVVADHARSDKLWVSYDKLSGEDLRVLLRRSQEPCATHLRPRHDSARRRHAQRLPHYRRKLSRVPGARGLNEDVGDDTFRPEVARLPGALPVIFQACSAHPVRKFPATPQPPIRQALPTMSIGLHIRDSHADPCSAIRPSVAE